MRPITMLAASLGLWALLGLGGSYALHLIASASEAVAMWRAMPIEQIALGVRP